MSTSSTSPPKWENSELYCLYNGFMLGEFISLAQFNFAREYFQILRARMQEFLDEIDLPLKLPTARKEYASKHPEFFQSTLTAVMKKSDRLARSVLFGTMAVHLVTVPDQPDDEREDMLEQCRVLLANVGLDNKPLDDFLEAAPHADGEHDLDLDKVLSPSLSLLAKVIHNLAGEERVCFVAMPFSAPFAGYYTRLYRPIMCDAGYLPFRAWGGLAAEEYSDLLVELIDKSGAFLADVTGANANVMYEVGLAHGMDKIDFLIEKRSKSAPPSNLRGIAAFQYSPRGKNWPDVTLEEFRLYRAMLDFAVDLKSKEENRA